MQSLSGKFRGTASAKSRALTGVALSALSLTMMLPEAGQAQQASDVQELTITGSRIRAPNLTSDSPVTGVTQDEVKQSNTAAVENLLNTLPSVTADLTATSTSQQYDTTAHVNLRDLGVTRTLVLIDGRRIGPSDPQSQTGAAADLNFIPSTLLSGVDVLTGGASAVYGSDAVAGVVNLHLIRNFQGAEFDFSFSAAQHDNNNQEFKQILANTQIVSPGFKVTAPPASVFDAFIRESSGIVGSNSSDGKGNITMYADYRATTPVTNASRDWNSCAVSATHTNNQNYKFCAGSSNNQYGKFQNLPGLPNGPKTVGDNPNGTATFVPFTTSLLFNFAAYQYLQRQDDRTALGTYGHYEIDPHADVYAELMFMDDSSLQQIGPPALPFGGQPGVQTTLTVPCTNPYIGKTVGPVGVSQYTALGCGGGAANATIFFPGLRLTLPRLDNITHDDYRAVAGVRGDIDGNFNYDLSGSHWTSNFNRKDTNFPLLNLVDQGITNGTLNIFQYGGITSAQQAAISEAGLIGGQTNEDDVTGSVNGDLGPYGGTSPFAKTPVSIAAGLEFRHDTLSLQPDGNESTGNLLFDTQVLPVSGGERSFEEFAELRAPLVQDKPYVESLNLNLALRHADYHVDNTNDGFSTNTYKISADYAPVDDIRFRGGYNRAARAPNVQELFAPDVFNADSGYDDPCAPNGNSKTPSAQFKAICTNPALGKAAVTAAQFNSGSVPQCPANECNNYLGGNLTLKPEEADTWTWGANFTPSMVPGLTASVDYWDVKVGGYIGTIQGSTIVNDCYAGVTQYCQYIQRDPSTGGLVGNGRVVETNVNLDQLHDRGIDVDLSYTRKLEDFGISGLQNMGALSFRLTGTYLISAVTQNQSVLLSYDCADRFGPNCGLPQPTWRHNLRTTWTTPWDADFSVLWRFIGGVSLDAADPNNPAYGSSVNCCGIPNGAVDSKIGDVSYIDLAASYKLLGRYTIRLGVNNLMDRDPPIVNQSYAINSSAVGTNGNTYNIYDTLGRVLFMSFSAKW